MDNFRAAMTWPQAPGSPPDASLRLTAALWRFWEMRGYPAEGREHLRAALNRPGLPDAPERAQLLLGAATLAFVQVELDEPFALGRESLERFRARDDPRGRRLPCSFWGTSPWKGTMSLPQLLCSPRGWSIAASPAGRRGAPSPACTSA